MTIKSSPVLHQILMVYEEMVKIHLIDYCAHDKIRALSEAKRLCLELDQQIHDITPHHGDTIYINSKLLGTLTFEAICNLDHKHDLRGTCLTSLVQL